MGRHPGRVTDVQPGGKLQPVDPQAPTTRLIEGRSRQGWPSQVEMEIENDENILKISWYKNMIWYIENDDETTK
jgi:hypothetical protein